MGYCGEFFGAPHWVAPRSERDKASTAFFANKQALQPWSLPSLDYERGGRYMRQLRVAYSFHRVSGFLHRLEEDLCVPP